MEQVLYRKWRPQSWGDVIGQEHIISTLRNAIQADRIAHAYLFSGPRGTGKTTTARILAKAVNCLSDELKQRPCENCDHCLAIQAGRFLDLIEIDAASNTGVDDVRDLREKINFSPNQGRYKVYIVDEVHMLSTPAFNALLKTLEEPPPHAIFVLATTEVHKIPATVLSRCQRHEFRRIPVFEIIHNLEKITEGEGITAQADALVLIARQATGSMRDAISLLDQLASTGETITLDMAQSVLGTATSQAVVDVVDALVQGKPAQGLDQIHRTLDGGSDPRQFTRQIVDYLRNLLLIHAGNADQIESTAEIKSKMKQHAQSFTTERLLSVIRSFNYAATEAKAIWQPSLPLEMAFIESLAIHDTTQNNIAGDKPDSIPSPSVSAPAIQERKISQLSKYDQLAEEMKTSPSVSEKAEKTAPDQQSTQTLSKVWPSLLNQVRQQNPKAYAMLNSTKSHFISGNNLMLGFANELLKNMMEEEGCIQVVQQVVNQLFDRKLMVICRIDTVKRDEIPAEVENDGMVAAALRDLGAEIVDVQKSEEQ